MQSSRDSLSLTGHVSSKEVADRAAALAAPFGKTIVNNLAASPRRRWTKQILLRVKFAELDRTASNQFAVNLVSTGATNTIGRITSAAARRRPARPSITGGGGQAANSNFTITDALNIFAFRPDLNLGAFLKALQQRNLLQILAEPNLVTSNGKEASFLVGGEFPIPVLQGGGNSGAVTIQFREFGIRLTFNPTLTENNTIRLYVRPEVSSLDFANALSFNGFTIPGAFLAQDGNQHRTGRRTEFRDRRAHGQPRDRNHFAHSGAGQPADPGKSVQEQTNRQEQHGIGGHGDA